MVGIVTGQGLGLQSSSALGLGVRGQLGTASFGQAGEQVTVNAANGNLILRDRDQWLSGLGPDSAMLRAYNSQGQLSGNGWRPGGNRSVDQLTGTVNSVGSTVVRTDWDGTAVTYDWDATRNAYVATNGAGTRDTLRWDTAAKQWTWTQGGGALIETYDAAQGGRLLAQCDRDGNTVQYHYNGAGQLSEVVTANGESTVLDYSAGRLSQIRTLTQGSGGTATATSVRYGYDGAGRLSTVALDLSPQDNSVTDGKVYTTTYTYDGSSARIASLRCSDGSELKIAYVDVGGEYRVATVTQTGINGEQRVTAFTYDVVGQRTIVRDPLGGETVLSYDAQGRLLKVESPAVNGVRQVQQFGYDAAGQIISVRDGNGNEVRYQYD
jgi:YD repeat-containing protein